MRKNFTLGVFQILTSLIISPSIFCQTWVGGNAVGNFTYTDNWANGNNSSWGFSDTLDFKDRTNTNQTSIYYDFTNWVDVASIFYNTSFPVSTIINGNGNGINFNNKIENQSSYQQEINIPVSFKGNDLQLNPVNGNLVFRQPIYNDNNGTPYTDYINIWGLNSHSLVFHNEMQGGPNTRLILQRDEPGNSNHYPVVIISTDMKSNSANFGGGAMIKAGELWFDAGGTINGGSIQVGNTAYTAKVFLNAIPGGQTIDNNISVPPSATMSHIGGLNTSGINTYSGTVTLNESASLESWSGGTINFSGDIIGSKDVYIRPVDGSPAGATIQYSGTAKSYTGTTNIETGTALRISSNQRLGNIVLNSGAILEVDAGVTLTITGTWIGGGTINNNGTIILQGPAAFPGSGTTVSAMNNLGLNKTGITLLDKSLAISGSLILNSGILNIGSNNLTLVSGAIVTGNTPSSSNMVEADGSGQFIKDFSSTGSFTYPVGDNLNYSPATITLTSISGTPSIGMNLVNAKHPKNLSPANYITRYWHVTASGGTYTANATFNYISGAEDVNGSESAMTTAGYNSGWTTYSPVNSSTHQLVVNGTADLNKDFTAGDQFSTSAGDYFRSHQSGAWNVSGDWESSPDNVNWTISSLVPDQNAKGITIQNGHTITLTANASAKLLTINSGGTLDNTNTGGGYLLTIYDDGTSASDFNINGTYVLYGTAPTLNSNVTVTVGGTGIVRANNNTGGGSDNFAQSTQVYFQTGSVFDWNTTYAFGTSSAIYFKNAGTNIATFRISQSPGSTGGVGSGSTTTFNGIVEVNANTLMTGSGEKDFRNGIIGSSTITQQSNGTSPNGRFVIQNTGAILGGTNLNIVLTTPMYLLKSVNVPATKKVTISGANVDNNVSGNVLQIDGTFDITSQQITNTNGTINISGTGLFRSSNTPGTTTQELISIPSGTVNLSAGSTVEMYALGSQTFKSRSDFSNLIFSGSGFKTPSSGFSPAGTITIKDNAIFDCTGYDVGGGNTNLTMTDNSRLIVSTKGVQPSMEGTYNLTGGTVVFASTNTTPETIRNGTYYNIEVTGHDSIKNSTGNIYIRDGGSFTVKSGGVFTMNNNTIQGSSTNSTATIVVENGGKFNSGNKMGFNGFTATFTDNSSIHSNITNISLQPGSTIIYSRPGYLSGGGDQTITNTNGLEYQNIILSGAGNKTAPSGTLVVHGDFTQNTGVTFVNNSGTVEFKNSTDQNINTAVPYPVFYDVLNNNTSSLNIKNNISVKNTLTLGNSSKINLVGDITLVSDGSNTASIPAIPEGANAASINYGTGRFNVQRYIPNHSKAWQLLSVPTKGSTIANSWQNKNPVAGDTRGTYIPGPYSDWSARGFDGMSYAPSMKTYNPATNSYIGVPNTSMLINNPNGYFIFIRGNRSVGPNDPPTDVTLFSAGKLYAPTPAGEGPVIINVPANSFAMVGNPYPSSVRYNQITRSPNIQADYYIWDPHMTAPDSSAYGLGAYRTIAYDDSKAIPSSRYYVDGSIPPIQSGQAFFVYNPSSTAGTVTFTEAAKTSGSNSIFRTTERKEVPSAMIAADLFLNTNGNLTTLDGTIQFFDKKFSNEIDRWDAKKFINSSENIYLPSVRYPLAIERRLPPDINDTTFLILNGLKKQNYSLQIMPDKMESLDLKPVLHDSFLNTTLPLNDGNNKIDFYVTNEKASYSQNRFFITFKAIPKPFEFSNEKGTSQGENIELTWTGINQDSVAYYTIERSLDTVNFKRIATVNSQKGSEADYSYTDSPESQEINYYRFTAHLNNGTLSISKIVDADVIFKTPSLSIYPNPVINHILKLHLTRMDIGKYKVRLFQQDGKLIYSGSIYHSIPSNEYKIEVPVFTNGLYQLEITTTKGIRKMEKVFIKR